MQKVNNYILPYFKRLKSVYSSPGEPISELLSVTYHTVRDRRNKGYTAILWLSNYLRG